MKLYKANLILIGVFAAITAAVLLSGEVRADGSWQQSGSGQAPHYQQHGANPGGNVFQQVYYLGAEKCRRFIDTVRGNEPAVQPVNVQVDVAIAQPLNGQVVYGDRIEVVVDVDSQQAVPWDLVVNGKVVERVHDNRAYTPSLSQGNNVIEAHLISPYDQSYVAARDVVQVQVNEVAIYERPQPQVSQNQPMYHSQQSYQQPQQYQAPRQQYSRPQVRQSQPQYSSQCRTTCSPSSGSGYSSSYGGSNVRDNNHIIEPYSYYQAPYMNAQLPCYLNYCR